MITHIGGHRPLLIDHAVRKNHFHSVPVNNATCDLSTNENARKVFGRLRMSGPRKIIPNQNGFQRAHHPLYGELSAILVQCCTTWFLIWEDGELTSTGLSTVYENNVQLHPYKEVCDYVMDPDDLME